MKLTYSTKRLGALPSFNIWVPRTPAPFGKHVRKQYKINYMVTTGSQFVRMMVKLAKKHQVLMVHNHGSFYSQDYLDKWKEIARQCPQTHFWFRNHKEILDTSELPQNVIYGGDNPSTCTIDKKCNDCLECIS